MPDPDATAAGPQAAHRPRAGVGLRRPPHRPRRARAGRDAGCARLRLARGARGPCGARCHPAGRAARPARGRVRGDRGRRAAPRWPARNRLVTPMIGLGYHGTVTPSVIRRNVLENPAWYTAYTPYQPEISQGRLEALVVFQTLVADLSGMALANASLLDEGTAAAEAMTLARRASKAPDGAAFVIDSDTHPQTIEVVRTRAEPLGLAVVVAPVVAPTGRCRCPTARCSACSSRSRPRPVPSATSSGLVAAVHDRGGLVTVAADPLALCLLRPPGEVGADVVVGSTQRFGVPLGYGGPHAGYMAVREGLQRSLPGRLVGVSVDADGDPAYRLALQTREQHIRREKATSNICTAQVLLAVVAAMYAVYHGPEGLRSIASARARQGVPAGRRRCAPAGSRWSTTRSSTRWPRGCPAGRRRSWPPPSSAGVNLRRVDDDTVVVGVRRDHHRRPPGRGVHGLRGRPGRCRYGRRGWRGRRGDPRSPAPHVGDAHPPDVPPVPVRDRDAALPAPAGRQGRRPRPLDDPARLLHDEAERHHGDGADQLARLRRDAPVRSGRPGPGVRLADRRPRAVARRDHRVRRRIPPAQRRLPGRARRAAGDPGVPPQPRRPRPGRVPHPVLRARHQRGLRGDGRHAGGRGRLRRRRQRRPRRPAGQAGRAHGTGGRADGHVPVDPRRVRGGDRGAVRPRARGRWAGVPRRRQPQRHGRPGPAGSLRCRRVAPQPAQDVLHPPRGRRAGGRADRRARPPRAVPAEPPARAVGGPGHRARDRSRPRPGGRPASCRSRGPTSG